jgi:NAD(P)H dehydrogenase (quinone)
MNVAIVIYSKTGTTFNIAQKISLLLTNAKISCDIIRLETNDVLRPRLKSVSISTKVNLDSYDIVIFGTPVWAFTAAPVLPAFLKSKPDLKGKKVLNYITMGLPFNFMGGNSAQTLVDTLTAECGATVINKGGIINQPSMHNAEKTNAFVKSIFDKIKN